MTRPTDDAGETSENVPRPRSYSGGYHEYNGLRIRSLRIARNDWSIRLATISKQNANLLSELHRQRATKQLNLLPLGTTNSRNLVYQAFVRGVVLSSRQRSFLEHRAGIVDLTGTKWHFQEQYLL
ncbi:unnamed protein product [Protopolystoma xenopodis]|uniref:Uncharacterized protein n=1 Tax=Protopolystoma xenopodis TaxID=117903 RepID=A0A3S5AMX9_9PLAT|nr:unnamed protein product [Protopolystoma xenopodis]